jgi:hypothetical protein
VDLINKLRIKDKDILKTGKVTGMIKIKLYKQYLDNSCPRWGTGGKAKKYSQEGNVLFCIPKIRNKP